jgi:hypothetical protein
MLAAADFSVSNNHRSRMNTTRFKPSNYRIAILFLPFMVCSLTLLCYESRLSRVAPVDTTPLNKSIKMDHERIDPSALEDDAKDDAGNKQFYRAPDSIPYNEVPAPILSQTGAPPDLQLDLILHSIHRRPPPICL